VYGIADDARPADWVVDGVRGFAESVLSLVPAGFPSYVRVFHPVRLSQPAQPSHDGVTWAELAAANGKRVHAGMQLNAIGADLGDLTNWASGTLAPDLASILVTALARHTRTPDRCYFAVWEGFGGLSRDVALAPTFTLPNRRYHLLAGPVDAARVSVLGDMRDQSPNIWWPEDRGWCVATEIDLQSTYVGCSAECLSEITSLDGVEAWAVPPETGVTFDSDTLN
jgi:hypothetical protein